MDVALHGIEESVNRRKASVKAEYNKKFVQQRAYRIENLTPMKSLFDDTHSKPLSNVFSNKSKELDSIQTNDLLGIHNIGTGSLVSYIRQPIKRK